MFVDSVELSIIVPVFNVEQFLGECIASIISVDLDSVEIIFIDDGSTDNSNHIIRKFMQEDNRIKLIVQENGGLSSARNAGLKIAVGTYVLFVDSDDILFGESLREALDNAKINNSDIVVCDYFEFESPSQKKYRFDRTYIPESVITDHELILSKLFYLDVNFAVWNKLYNRAFLNINSLCFKEKVWFEDLDFVFSAFCKAKIISKENSILIGYRQRAGSIMKTVSSKILDKKTILYDIKKKLENSGEIQLLGNSYKYLFFKMYISIIYQVLKNRGTISEKKEILSDIFEDRYFYEEILHDFKDFNRLRFSEKLLFIQLRSRILNNSTIQLYNMLL